MGLFSRSKEISDDAPLEIPVDLGGVPDAVPGDRRRPLDQLGDFAEPAGDSPAWNMPDLGSEQPPLPADQFDLGSYNDDENTLSMIGSIDFSLGGAQQDVVADGFSAETPPLPGSRFETGSEIDASLGGAPSSLRGPAGFDANAETGFDVGGTAFSFAGDYGESAGSDEYLGHAAADEFAQPELGSLQYSVAVSGPVDHDAETRYAANRAYVALRLLQV